MKCGKARSLFSAYLDKDLTFDEQARLEEHLCGCQDCAGELRGVTRMQSLLRSLTPIEVGDDFCERVQRRVREAAEQPADASSIRLGDLWRWWQRQVWLRPALGAALGLVAGILVGVNAPQFAGRSAGAVAGSAPFVAVPSNAGGTVGPSMVSQSAGPGPFSGIDLSHLASVSDSARLSGPEYVLEPYVTDPQRGLVPATGTYGRTVGADWDDQNDAFVTF